MLSNWVNMGENMLAYSLFDEIWEGTYWHAHSLMESNPSIFLLNKVAAILLFARLTIYFIGFIQGFTFDFKLSQV